MIHACKTSRNGNSIETEIVVVLGLWVERESGVNIFLLQYTYVEIGADSSTTPNKVPELFITYF